MDTEGLVWIQVRRPAVPGTQEVLHKRLLLLVFFAGRFLAFGNQSSAQRERGECLPGVGCPVSPGPNPSRVSLPTTFAQVGTIVRPVFRAMEQIPKGTKVAWGSPVLGTQGWGRMGAS